MFMQVCKVHMYTHTFVHTSQCTYVCVQRCDERGGTCVCVHACMTVCVCVVPSTMCKANKPTSSYFTMYVHVQRGQDQGCTHPCSSPSSCPTHLAGRSTAPLSCSVEAVSAAQTPSHLRPPSWPSCPPLLPPGGDHHHPPPVLG